MPNLTSDEIRALVEKAGQWMSSEEIDSLCELEPEEIRLAVESRESSFLPLRPKYKAFVHEYLIDLNGSQAAIRAGYSVIAAKEIASRLLTVANIRHAIDVALAQRNQRVGIKQDDVLNEMALLAMSSLEHYFIDDFGQVKLTPGAPIGAMRAVKSIKKSTRVDKEGNTTHSVDLQLWDKPGTLKLTGRHVGLYADRLEHTGANGGPIEITKIVREIIDPAKRIEPSAGSAIDALDVTVDETALAHHILHPDNSEPR